jgi:hypothetical protein
MVTWICTNELKSPCIQWVRMVKWRLPNHSRCLSCNHISQFPPQTWPSGSSGPYLPIPIHQHPLPYQYISPSTYAIQPQGRQLAVDDMLQPYLPQLTHQAPHMSMSRSYVSSQGNQTQMNLPLHAYIPVQIVQPIAPLGPTPNPGLDLDLDLAMDLNAFLSEPTWSPWQSSKCDLPHLEGEIIELPVKHAKSVSFADQQVDAPSVQGFENCMVHVRCQIFRATRILRRIGGRRCAMAGDG